MDDFKTRLIYEHDELQQKFEKLEKFLDTENFNNLRDIQQTLLRIQFDAMSTYLTCLSERILNL